MIRRWLTLILAGSLVSCAGVKGAPVTMETLDQVAVQVHQSHLSDTEKQEFDEAKSRADDGDYDVTNKTVGQMIADQAAYDADQRAQAEKAAALAAQARARHNAQVSALRHALTVALVNKGFEPADYENFEYQSHITIELALRNNTRKTIRAIQGSLNFETPLGDSLYQTNFEESDAIAPGSSITWDGSTNYNEFDNDQVRLRNADLQNIKLDWEPKTILFTDGSRLEVTE
jgi:hypothetical protein